MEAIRTSWGRFVGLTTLSCLALLLCGSVARGDDPVLRFDLTAEQYAAELKAAEEAGLAPTQLAVYAEGDAPRFALVLERAGETPWIEKHLLTPQEFQDQFEAYLGQGFRPVSMAVSQQGDAPRFSAVWWKIGEPAWHLHLDVAADELEKLTPDYAEKDLRPVSILGYAAAGQTRFATLWERGDQKTEYDLGLSNEDYRKALAARTKANFSPRSLQTYPTEKGARIAAVWVERESKAAPVAEVRAVATRNEFSDLVKTGTRGGRVLSLSTTVIEGTPVFSVIVERGR